MPVPPNEPLPTWYGRAPLARCARSCLAVDVALVWRSPDGNSPSDTAAYLLVGSVMRGSVCVPGNAMPVAGVTASLKA